MSLTAAKRKEIINRILKEIKRNNTNPLAIICDEFGISRQTAHKYLAQLVDSGLVLVSKQESKKRYELKEREQLFEYETRGLEEDVVWRNSVEPIVSDLPHNVLDVCKYGFTEMLNNAIDHSESDKVFIVVTVDAISVEFLIMDHGVGIFHKIQQALGLDDPKQSILELAKGKFTTDPHRHSGEGIFFTSHVFDSFYIRSRDVFFLSGRNDGDGYMFEDNGRKENGGTTVIMSIARDSNVVLKDIFDEFMAADDEFCGFSKTVVPVRLAEHEGGSLVSRSQAKRLIRRFDKFIEVILDFRSVTEIGQAFADELFRVFKLDHPKVHLIPINMTPDVQKMVTRASAKYEETIS